MSQDFAIVKVKDVRDKSYLQEVTKYAVKGNDLASWSGSDINTFISAIKGTRCFGVFGSAFKERKERKMQIEELLEYEPECDQCHGTKLRVGAPEDIEYWEARYGNPAQNNQSINQSNAVKRSSNRIELSLGI